MVLTRHRTRHDEAATRRAPAAAHLRRGDRDDDAVSFRDLPPENPHLLRARPGGPSGRVNVQCLGLAPVPLTAPTGDGPWRHTTPVATPEENAAAIRATLADIRKQLAEVDAR